MLVNRLLVESVKIKVFEGFTPKMVKLISQVKIGLTQDKYYRKVSACFSIVPKKLCSMALLKMSL